MSSSGCEQIESSDWATDTQIVLVSIGLCTSMLGFCCSDQRGVLHSRLQSVVPMHSTRGPDAGIVDDPRPHQTEALCTMRVDSEPHTTQETLS